MVVPGSRGMSHDVAANWFLRISRKHGSTVHLGNDLVRNNNGYAELKDPRALLL